jgi:hypothetical protein
MRPTTPAVPRRFAAPDVPASKRHDGSLDGYRRQRRLALQRARPPEGFVALLEPGRTQ